MAVSYYLRPKEPKKLLLVDGGRHDPNFVTLCNSSGPLSLGVCEIGSFRARLFSA